MLQKPFRNWSKLLPMAMSRSRRCILIDTFYWREFIFGCSAMYPVFYFFDIASLGWDISLNSTSYELYQIDHVYELYELAILKFLSLQRGNIEKNKKLGTSLNSQRWIRFNEMLQLLRISEICSSPLITTSTNCGFWNAFLSQTREKCTRLAKDRMFEKPRFI